MKFFKLKYTFSYFNEDVENIKEEAINELQDSYNLVTIQTINENSVTGVITCYRWAENIEELAYTLDHFNDDLIGESYTITSLDGLETITK